MPGPVNALWGLPEEVVNAGEIEHQWSVGNYRVRKWVERDFGASS